jgi:hypothetical protein
MSPHLTHAGTLLTLRTRTHRERKEQYVKEVEAQNLRNQELNIALLREKEAMARELQRLRDLLISHGLNPDDVPPSHSGGGGNAGGGGAAPSSSGSVSGSYAMDSARSQFTPSTSPQQFDTPSSYHNQSGGGYSRTEQPSLDYDQIGLKFVLQYDSSFKSPIFASSTSVVL